MPNAPRSIRRRDVLRGGSVAAASLLAAPVFGRARRDDEVVRLGIVGLRGRGWNHYHAFKGLPGVQIVALCDVDAEVLTRRAAEAAPEAAAAGREIATFADVRDLLARDDVDAVSIATPNHLHALHTVWACEAGKHVYVEKPVSHNLWEGRRMVEIARRTNRIVQAGTQSRSSPAINEAIAWFQAGGLGAPKLAQGLCYKPRKSIGRVPLPLDPPAQVNHDLWSGPRQPGPVQRAQYHYDWHWQWPFGNGDLGNQGVHQMDLCRWALGAKALPTRIVTAGGRFGYADDGTTPNTLVAYYDLQPAPMVFEVRGLPKDLASQALPDWGANMDRVHGTTISVIVYAEQGRLTITSDYSVAVAHDHEGKELRRWKQDGDHFANFIDAVRLRDPGALHADVAEGHLSAGYCHIANDSIRLGQRDSMESIERAVADAPHALDAMARMRAHLVANGVELDKDRPTFGRTLAIDPVEERYVGDADAESLRRGTYRQGFTISESV
ncbi:MAG: Gfo/Idh/MocA family oxidoreductase [Planctomycetota bacterium]